MKTSYFAKWSKNLEKMPGAISIARSKPRWFKCDIPTYSKLAPNANEDQLDFRNRMIKLNPEQVFKDLVLLADGHEPILLCHEKSDNYYCHRYLVADWLSRELNIKIEEWNDGNI
jgi:hypothetical protein